MDDALRVKTPSERVRACEARKVNAGGRRLPGSVLTPEAATALVRLLRNSYAASITGCIERALIEAEERLNGD